MSEKIKENKKKIKENVTAKKKAVKENAIAVHGSLKQRRAGNPNTVTNNRLEMLVTVVSRNKAEYYVDLIQSFDVNMQIMALAEGTADAKTMRYLGLTDSGKSVIFSIIQENKLPDALNTLEEKFNAVKGGKGIAFTIPLTSVMGKLLFGFLSNNKTVVKEGK